MKNYLPLKNVSLFLIITILLSAFYAACDSISSANPVPSAIKHSINTEAAIPKIADAATILKRAQVPVLCYHQIRDWSSSDSKGAKDYIVPISNFREQMKWLADNDYHTISPDQLYDYLLKGTTLPSNPVMVTYDDSRKEQFSIAHEEMNKYGFKGVYFIMTVSLGRPGYMTKQEVKQLSDEGNTVGSHTWNHSNVKNYSSQDWSTQIDKPLADLGKNYRQKD
jgi:peptidoglycan/xylan/chitin deacetylase (PgdA/CDA1 family)